MRSRRRFLRDAAGAIAGTATLPFFTGCARKAESRQDLIVVTLDTTGSRHLGCYGYSRDTCPNLDAFSEKAVLFEKAYANNHATLPAHATLFTGLYPHNHGVVLQQPLNAKRETLATLLKARGYQTAAVTANSLLSRETIGQGFDSFACVNDGRAQGGVDKALDWLAAHEKDDKPLFLWLHFMDPHADYAPPQPFRSKFLDPADEEVLRAMGVLSGWNLKQSHTRDAAPYSETEQRVVIGQHDGEIAYMDHHLGRFLEYVAGSKRLNRSILAVAADHGESLFENHSHWLSHATVHEPVVHIPFILSHPDYVATRVDGLVQQTDLLPTLSDWLDFEVPAGDGYSLADMAARGGKVRDVALFSELGDTIFGATDGRYKLREHGKHHFDLPIPEEWQHQIDSLPTMPFVNDLENVRFADTSGVLEDVCVAPDACLERLDRFEFQHMASASIDAFIMDLPTERDGRLGRHLMILHSERLWNRHARAPHNTFRIVALDKRGQVIATTKVVRRKFDTPLGTSEVYDLDNDPNERSNLAHTGVSVPGPLSDALCHYAKASAARLGIPDDSRVGIGEELEEQLTNLGYLE